MGFTAGSTNIPGKKGPVTSDTKIMIMMMMIIIIIIIIIII